MQFEEFETSFTIDIPISGGSTGCTISSSDNSTEVAFLTGNKELLYEIGFWSGVIRYPHQSNPGSDIGVFDPAGIVKLTEEHYLFFKDSTNAAPFGLSEHWHTSAGTDQVGSTDPYEGELNPYFWPSNSADAGDGYTWDGNDPAAFTCLLYTSPSPRD